MKKLAYILIILLLISSCNEKKKGKNVSNENTETLNCEVIHPDSIIETDECIVRYDKQPEYPDGMSGLFRFIKENQVYPETAIEDSIEGRVFVSFTVNEDGSVSNSKILKGVRDDLDNECLRIVKLMPNWIPGEHEGKKIKMEFRMPFRFRLTPEFKEEKSKENSNNNKNESNSLKIYPNPATEFINIELSSFTSNSKCQIIDNKGRCVREVKLQSQSQKIEIFDLDKGLYIVNLISMDKGIVASKKLIKE